MIRSVEIRGENEFSLPVGDIPEEFSLECRDFSFRCATSGLIEGRWRGVPMGELIEAAAVPPEATHLLVEGADGYREAIPVTTAINGLLALEREDEGGKTPRFLAPRGSSEETVANVALIDWATIEPGKRVESYVVHDTDG